MTIVATDAALIAALIDDLYAAFLAGDRQRFDGHLHADVTTWETHLPGPLRTRAELDAYRDQRDAAGERPQLAVLAAQDKRIDVWGDVGLARYLLIARAGAEEPPSSARVTDVLRRVDGRWQIVHHHAESLREPVAAR
ncbi:nuclear transport factor 2 family protein [Micromonospora sp. NPDC003241]